ncbi:TetR/AcrR family transcriptional regulator [Cytobacillus purgationiresistens]|uniref:AcrR family transcriptional regulator n=1 Tax=Cytobacillus purgationiresistens TaxID=863449 RepID=A0ABU0ARG1_9BACI|nr:TetR/AcrR family transcriptional regulator C-terminal domain-containing protein [Cytobacillus purgationiresistens]MDQ0273827.1 AcrR family transcriptional regulator [Cytobacillus purgationiresistens]
MSELNTDRRIRKTKKVIRDALTDLMEEKGFDGITVRDLTERADINRGTFYLHYRDKYDLLEQSEEEILTRLKKMQLDIKDLDIEDLYEYYLKEEPFPFVVQLFEYIQINGKFMRILMGPKGDPAFPSKLKSFLSGNMMQNLYGKANGNELNIPVDYIIAYVLSAQVGLIQQWLNSGMKESPKEIALIVLNITFMGPLQASGIISLEKIKRKSF